jgi:acetyl-CoA acetyltransferase/uncharacterized OB-fold protein
MSSAQSPSLVPATTTARPPAAPRHAGALPRPTPETQPFWQSLKEGRLDLPWCQDCGQAHFYPRLLCPHCGGERLQWRVASGRGRIHTFVINHKAPKGWTGPVPYVIAVVELDEGPRLLTNLETSEPPTPENVRIGQPVTLAPRVVTEQVTLPWFRLDVSAAVEADARAASPNQPAPRAWTIPDVPIVKRGRPAAAIVGAAESEVLGQLPHLSRLGLHADAARRAVADAGLKLSDVDGLFSTVAGPNELSEYLGLVPRYVDSTSVGGCSYMIMVRHAVAAIQAGYCSVALIVHGESGRSRIDTEAEVAPASPPGQFEAPFGTAGAPTTFSLPVLRHFHQFGTTKLQMSHVPAATREWALLNPKAIMHSAGAITPEDVMTSRMVCYPYNLLDCCLVADGGGALVVVAADRAQDFPHRPVYVLGTGEAAAHRQVGMMRDFTVSDSSVLSGRQAFAEAGLGPKDIQHLMLYDAFSFTPMMFLEDLGFVGRGESGAFVSQKITGKDGKPVYATGPGGILPMNTNGGGLSYCHTGRYGMFALLESVYQLRGQAGARQVPDLDISIAHGPGRQFAAAGTVIMGNTL